MDLKNIEKLMAAMGRTGMKRMVIKEQGYEIELEREVPLYEVSTVSMPHFSPSHLPVEAQSIQSRVETQGIKNEGKESQYITSPMVGTFYATASPGAPPFIKVGDTVAEGTVVCIIEAMKVMNEIKAMISGVVAEVLVKNGEPVEFGTKIFRIS